MEPIILFEGQVDPGQRLRFGEGENFLQLALTVMNRAENDIRLYAVLETGNFRPGVDPYLRQIDSQRCYTPITIWNIPSQVGVNAAGIYIPDSGSLPLNSTYQVIGVPL